MNKISSENSNVKITHHLSNEEARKSIKGYKVPINERTIAAYQILARYEKRKA